DPREASEAPAATRRICAAHRSLLAGHDARQREAMASSPDRPKHQCPPQLRCGSSCPRSHRCSGGLNLRGTVGPPSAHAWHPRAPPPHPGLQSSDLQSRIGMGGSRTSRTAVEGYGVPRGASPYWVQGRCARSVGRCRRGLPLVDRSELLYAPCSARFEGCTIAEVLKRQRRITPEGKLQATPAPSRVNCDTSSFQPASC